MFTYFLRINNNRDNRQSIIPANKIKAFCFKSLIPYILINKILL